MDNSILSALIGAAGAIIAAIITFRAALVKHKRTPKVDDHSQPEHLDVDAAEQSVFSWLVPAVLLAAIVLSTGAVIWMQLQPKPSLASPNPPTETKPALTPPIVRAKPPTEQKAAPVSVPPVQPAPVLHGVIDIGTSEVCAMVTTFVLDSGRAREAKDAKRTVVAEPRKLHFDERNKRFTPTSVRDAIGSVKGLKDTIEKQLDRPIDWLVVISSRHSTSKNEDEEIAQVQEELGRIFPREKISALKAEYQAKYVFEGIVSANRDKAVVFDIGSSAIQALFLEAPEAAIAAAGNSKNRYKFYYEEIPGTKLLSEPTTPFYTNNIRKQLSNLCSFDNTYAMKEIVYVAGDAVWAVCRTVHLDMPAEQSEVPLTSFRKNLADFRNLLQNPSDDVLKDFKSKGFNVAQLSNVADILETLNEKANIDPLPPPGKNANPSARKRQVIFKQNFYWPLEFLRRQIEDKAAQAVRLEVAPSKDYAQLWP